MPVEMLDAAGVQEAVQQTVADLMGGSAGRRREMQVIYAKRPMTDPNTKKPISMAGWVTWVDNDVATGAIYLKLAQGWKLLQKYGILGLPNGTPDPRGNWAKILEQPGGPEEFPVDQLLEFGWYDPERVPVPGVRFPQLRGMSIPEYPCPECNDRMFLKPIHLARHCRNQHNYDRKDIQDLAEQLGVDLVREMYQGRERKRVYNYEDEPEEESQPKVPPEYAVERVEVRPRGERPARKPKSNQWTPERRAEASRRAKERLHGPTPTT